MESTKDQYSNYVDGHKTEIIDDFCKLIKEEEIGDLTLSEFSKYKFWKYDQEDTLKKFYIKFRRETKSDLDYDTFCGWTWQHLDSMFDDEDVPKELKTLLEQINMLSINDGGAEA